MLDEWIDIKNKEPMHCKYSVLVYKLSIPEA
jgi:hypothetical protein